MASGSNIDPSHIKFGKSVYINPKIRLPQFDNGDSLAYQAYDSQNKEGKFIAIIAGVENIPRWNAVAAYAGLADTSFMRLVGSGVVNWSLENKQKYVFMYSGGLGKCLVEEGGFSEHHWRHPDIVEYFIQPMARMFKEMSDKNFAHGSICPSNIYYSGGGANSPVILGDGLSACAGSTQDALFFPPSKALAHPMGRGIASLEDDIYAFGVSLVLFLRKGNHLNGLSNEDIVRRKIDIGSYATLIGQERFPASFLDLLRGVLHDCSSSRWGVDEFFSWLDGTRLSPEPLTKKKKANRSIDFCGKKYLYAEFLALDLHKNPNELSSIIENGSLGKWVERSVDDTPMTERYIKALERSLADSDNKDYLAAQIAIALNPSLPLHYKGKCFTYDGLGSMMAKTICDGGDMGYYKSVLNLSLPDQALAGAGLPQNEVLANLKQFDTCRSVLRMNNMGYGIERCVYILCDSAPCLSPKLEQYFINSDSSVIMAFEDMCKRGGQIALMIDQHLAAFYYVAYPNIMGSIAYDLNSPEKDSKIAANLRFMAGLQKRARINSVPAIARVFLESLSGVYKAFNNKEMQKVIKSGVEEAAKDGDLPAMAALLDDKTSLARDKKAFQIASAEYRMLEDEYNQYNIKLANKKTYGVVSGHDAAAVVSWLAATIITVIVILAFISGNRIF